MIDRGKVVKGLTECVTTGVRKACPADCPYLPQCFPDVGIGNPFMPLMQDALTLLKEQEARIRELEEELRALKYGDQDTLKSAMMPAT